MRVTMKGMLLMKQIVACLLVALFSAAMLLPAPAMADFITRNRPEQVFEHPSPDPASGGSSGFGTKVALSGNKAIITGYKDYTMLYLFEADTGNLIDSFRFGPISSVKIDIDGDRVIAGNFGAAYLFDISSGIEQVATFPFKGRTVAIEGDIVALQNLGVNSSRDNNEVYVYDISVSTKEPKAILRSPIGSVRDFGKSLDIDDGRILVGSTSNALVGTSKGTAFLFDASGNRLQTFEDNEVTRESNNNSGGFGQAVGIDGDYVVISFPLRSFKIENDEQVDKNDQFKNSGLVYVFSARTGKIMQTLIRPVIQGKSRSWGLDLEIDGKEIVINSDSGTDVYHFNAETGELVEVFVGPNTKNLSGFGGSLSLDGDNVLIGAPRRLGDGKAYLYKLGSGLGSGVTGGTGGTGDTTPCECGSNQPPTPNEIPDQTLVEGKRITPIDLFDSFSDPDGDELTYSVSGLPEGLKFNREIGYILGTPATGTAGEYDIVVTADDGNGHLVDNKFQIKISSGNKPPTAQKIPDQTYREGESITPLDFVSAFRDPANGAPVSINISGLPKGLDIDAAENGKIAGVPATGTAGEHEIKMTVTYGNGHKVDSFFKIKIEPANNPNGQ